MEGLYPFVRVGSRTWMSIVTVTGGREMAAVYRLFLDHLLNPPFPFSLHDQSIGHNLVE